MMGFFQIDSWELFVLVALNQDLPYICLLSRKDYGREPWATTASVGTRIYVCVCLCVCMSVYFKLIFVAHTIFVLDNFKEIPTYLVSLPLFGREGILYPWFYFFKTDRVDFQTTINLLKLSLNFIHLKTSTLHKMLLYK
jgi:hypothetical protein